MPLQEIDTVELEALRRKASERDATVGYKTIVDKLGASPDTRNKLLKLFKELDPRVVIPEIDAVKPINDELDKFKKQLEDERTLRAKERDEEKKDREEEKKRIAAEKEQEDLAKREANTRQEIEKGRAYLRTNNLTAEGIDAVESLMMAKNIVDYEVALAAWEKLQPPSEPALPNNFGRSWDLFTPPQEENNIKEVLTSPNPKSAHRKLMKWQDGEILAWAKERNIPLGRRRA